MNTYEKAIIFEIADHMSENPDMWETVLMDSPQGCKYLMRAQWTIATSVRVHGFTAYVRTHTAEFKFRFGWVARVLCPWKKKLYAAMSRVRAYENESTLIQALVHLKRVLSPATSEREE